MKYFVLSLLLLSTVSGEQSENKLSKDLGEMLDSITKSIEDTSETVVSNEVAFGDFLSMFNESTSDSKTKSVSKRNVTLVKEDFFIQEMRRKCNIYGTPENYKDVSIAFDNYKSCSLGLEESIRTELNDKDLKMDVVCRLASEIGECSINLTDAIQPCLPRYKGGNFPFSNMTRAVIDYACVDQSAQERAKLFAGNWSECIERNKNDLGKCFNSSFSSGGGFPKIEENTYLFNEEDCSKMNELTRCLVRELNTTCNPSVVNFLEGLERVKEQFYTPCPTARHSEDLNLIS